MPLIGQNQPVDQMPAADADPAVCPEAAADPLMQQQSPGAALDGLELRNFGPGILAAAVFATWLSVLVQWLVVSGRDDIQE